VPERKLEDDYGETTVLPEHLRPDRVEVLDDAAAEALGRYQEYVRSLDEVPVLVDVVQEPPRAVSRDFRLGQRPDARKAPRSDAAALRDQHSAEVARQYAEYVEICAALHDANRVGPRAAPSKDRRKARAQKKRAKRAKRSARSKH
jgi:hypothetical protein